MGVLQIETLVDRAAERLPSGLSDDQIQLFTRLLQKRLKEKASSGSASTLLGDNSAVDSVLSKCLKYMPQIRQLTEEQSRCPHANLECPGTSATAADGTEASAPMDTTSQKEK